MKVWNYKKKNLICKKVQKRKIVCSITNLTKPKAVLECSTWHKFPNPGGVISTKKYPISNPGGTILTKKVLFTTQGVEFWSNMSY